MALSKDGKVELEDGFFGRKTANIAKSGYGKSYTGRVVCEEGREKGVPIVVIDPQDAYLGMEGFEYINAHQVKSAKALGRLVALTGKSIVIRMKKLTIEDQNNFLAAFLIEYKRNMRRGIQYIIIDEIHKYAPEGEKTASKEHVRAMFQENRSDGLGAMAISQRPARVDKTILAQCDHYFFGRVTAFTDKRALMNYLDEKEDMNKLPKLKKGEFYLIDVVEEPTIVMIREANTEHSGNSPKNLLNEDDSGYNSHINKIVVNKPNEVQKNMTDNVSTEGEPLKNVLPSLAGAGDLVMIGMKSAVGAGLAGLTGGVLGNFLKSPIPVVSSRTLGAAGTSVAMYTGYRLMPSKLEFLKDSLKYGAAGGAAFTVGSAAFDVIAALRVNPPRIAQAVLSMATGASPVSVEGSGAEGGVDLNTNFA